MNKELINTVCKMYVSCAQCPFFGRVNCRVCCVANREDEIIERVCNDIITARDTARQTLKEAGYYD